MRRGAAFWLGAMLAAAPLPSAAAERDTGAAQPSAAPPIPVLFSADEVQYDSDLGLIVAKGHVELNQRDQILLADTVTYNQRTDTATASGHVSLLQPSGDIVFADYVELRDNMREGFLQNVRMLLADRSRLAGNTARRVEGNRTEIRRGVYSACDPCLEDPTQAPVWQIKAEDIIHDKQLQIVEYRDAVMEIDGVPVLWTPYISHPDPSVKRASGFLSPTFGTSTANGYRFGIPYYWVIGPDSDATFEPIYFTQGGTFLGGQYRQFFGFGRLTTDASVTVGSRAYTDLDTEPVSSTRWNINTESEFDLDQDWRAGALIERESDPTYLLRYHLPSPYNFLTSHIFAENFGTRSYGNISAWGFQSLETGVGDSTEPFVAPVADYQWVSEPDGIGGRLAIEGNAMNLMRISGIDTRRSSVGGEWRLPFADAIGGQYALAVGLRADGYQSDNLPVATGGTESAWAGRAFPQIALTWRYPWVRREEGYSQVIEPVAMVAAAPNGGNPGTIPNEDSQGFEFDDTSLFRRNRFPGFDRVDSGQRVDYGLRTGIYGDSGGSTRFIIGQSYTLQTNDNFLPGSGLEHHVSDVVGKATISPTALLDFTYRFRLGYDDLAMRRQEVGTSFGPSNLRMNVNYVQVEQIPNALDLQKVKEVSATMQIGLTRFWSLQLVGTYDFSSAPASAIGQLVGTTETLNQGIAVTYRDECLAVVTSLSEVGIRSGDAIPGTALLVTFVFKNIGDIGTKLASFPGL
ncbi:MAG TPA: LPS assembly protein LptD [Stellaceae bacterium]|nr:LPS assembly protein LptD [Stellaceae bacterium]